MYEQDACRDSPKGTDYLYSELGGEVTDIPERVFYPVPEIQNQGADPTTKMACGSFGMIHAVNTVNEVNIESKPIVAKDYWINKFVSRYKRDDYNPIEMGSSLQDQLRLANHEELIDGYARLDKEKESYQLALANTRIIYTGSKNINRVKTRDSKDKFAVIGTGSAHIFAIVGYGKQGLIAVNSYGKEYMDDGYFYIYWGDIPCLFSAYALFDHRGGRTMNQRRMAWKKYALQQQYKREHGLIK